MLDAVDFVTSLKAAGIKRFYGVPDSLLKEFCACVSSSCSDEEHIIAANEGTAVGLAIGYHLATSKVACVYLQNSGTGNIINPVLSLADRRVYGIPVLFLIGWRGRPGEEDEPQHAAQGLLMEQLLHSLEIKHKVLSEEPDEAQKDIESAIQYCTRNNETFAFLVKKGTFMPYKKTLDAPSTLTLTREKALEILLDGLSGSGSPETFSLVSTTGMASRELYELREMRGEGHEDDFLTVGGMGHCSSIALGVVTSKKERYVVCIDGDGAAIMHMGAFATIGIQQPKNFLHVLINNGAHDSVGGQPTGAFKLKFTSIACACGYSAALKVNDEVSLRKAVQDMIEIGKSAPALLEIHVVKGARANLGRPKINPKAAKNMFMQQCGNYVD